MKAFKICILMIPFILLTGCWDKIELEEQAYVVVIGVDKGEGNNISVTYQIANPQGGVGSTMGESEKEPPYEVVTVESPGIVAARDLVGAFVTRRPTFSHVTTIIVSEEFARSEDLISFIQAAIRERQIRRDAFFIVTKERASEFIRNNNPLLETRPHKYYQFMKTRWDETALVGPSDIHTYIRRTEGNESLYLAIYATTKSAETKKGGEEDDYLAGQIKREGGNKAEMIGSAVFKEGKMIGTITGEENRIALIMRPEFRIDSLLSTYPDPLKKGYRVTTRISNHEKTQIKMNLTKEKPIIDVTIPISMNILAIPSGIDYVEDLEKQQKLKNNIEETLNKKALELVKKTQNEFKGEPFLWSYIIRKNFSTWQEYENYNWMDRYPEAEVHVKYDITIQSFGKELKPLDYERIKD